MTHPPVRFAVIGCGMLARMQHLPNIVSLPSASLSVCCDLSDENLAICKESFAPTTLTKDFHAAIQDPTVDAICLATTEKLRLPVIAAAAEAGKPVYVEKPLARSLEEVLEIQRVVNAAGIPVCVGHNRRSAPAMIEAHRIFRSHMDDPQPNPWRWKREGDDLPSLPDEAVAAINVRINDDWHSWKSWVFDPEQAPHGPMLFEMTHFTDVCNWMLNDTPVEVVAVETGMLQHSVIVSYKSGALATLMLASNGSFSYPKELYEMFGRGGVVAIDHMVEVRTSGIANEPTRQTFDMLNDHHPGVGTEGGIQGWLAKKQAACEEAVESGDLMRQFTAEPDKGHASQLARFIDQINGDGPEVCGIDDAVMATRVAFAAIQSAKEKRPVAL